MEWWALALGGALGTMVRGRLLRMAGPTDRLSWPPGGPAWATLIANTAGCLIFGAWVARVAPWLADHPLAITARMAITAGFCGGLTTFSSLCADAVRLTRHFGLLYSGLYLALTILLGLGGFWLTAGLGPG
jgi:CrcB protein